MLSKSDSPCKFLASACSQTPGFVHDSSSKTVLTFLKEAKQTGNNTNKSPLRPVKVSINSHRGFVFYCCRHWLSRLDETLHVCRFATVWCKGQSGSWIERQPGLDTVRRWSSSGLLSRVALVWGFMSLSPSLFFFLCLSVSFLSVSLYLFLSLILSVSSSSALFVCMYIYFYLFINLIPLILFLFIYRIILSLSLYLFAYLSVSYRSPFPFPSSLSVFPKIPPLPFSLPVSVSLSVCLFIRDFSHLSVFLKVGGSHDIKYHLRFKRHWFIYRLAFFK